MGGKRLGRWQVVESGVAVADVLEVLGEPGTGVVLLTGQAGIGKTALAQRVSSAAEDSGQAVVRVVASMGSTGRPFGALGRLLEVPDDQGLAATGGPRIDFTGSTPGSGRRRLLVVDDMPLLDQASAVEVARLVRSGDVVVLATARAGTSLPSAVDGLAVEGRMVVQQLHPLGADPIARAAEAALGAPLSDSALDAILTRSGGVPLHARELVTTNVAAGRLAIGGDRWDLDGDLLAPPTLFELVSSRFLQLDAPTRRSVEALCISQPLPVAAATELVGIDVLVDLEQNELVTVTDEANVPTVRLSHPLYEESVLASFSPLRRRAAVERAVDALGAAAAEDADLAYRLACLRVDHDLPIDPADAIVAAQRSLNLLDPARAQRLLSSVVSADRSADGLLMMGAALAAQGMTDEADEVLAEAWDLAIDDEHRARVLSRRAGNLGPGTGRFDDAIRLLVEGLDDVQDPRWRAFLEADLAYFRSWAGERAELTATDVDGSPQVRANECLVGAIMAAMAGELSVVEPLVEEGLELVPSIERDVPHARDVLMLSRFLGKAFAGDAAGARAVADDQLESARSTSSGATGVWLSVRALQALVDGDSSRALDEAEEAVDSLVLGDVAGLRPLALAVRSVAFARRGELEASRSDAAAIDPAWRDEVKVQILLTQAAAWQEVVSGARSAGIELLAQAGRVGLESHHLPLGALASYDAVRLGHARSVIDVLRSTSDGWDGPMSRTITDHAELLVTATRPADRDLDHLVEVAEVLPSLGLTIAAVGAWVQVAETAAAQGRDDVLRRARFEVSRSRLYDIATPGGTRPQLLTERELEVARAVAAGDTSREVAANLGRSVRTVDNHLASVYRKLGVSRRSDLAPVLAELDGSSSTVESSWRT